MTKRKSTGKPTRPAAAPRIGLFGHLGAGNIGKPRQLGSAIAECREAKAEHIDQQFAALSAPVSLASKIRRVAREHKPASWERSKAGS